MVATMPRDGRLESTLAMLADPYRYISSQCRRLGTEAFEARIMLQPTICFSGAQAAAVFYDTDRFQRATAAPEPVRATLFGKVTVQNLDADAHRVRKAMFVDVLNAAAVQSLVQHTSREWHAALSGGTAQPLYELTHCVLTRAVCRWAGVPLSRDEAPRRQGQLVALFDDAARNVASHFRARTARGQAERWLAGVIDNVRAGRYTPPADSVLAAVARHRDADGQAMSSHVAAAELLNVLRPVVAVSVYIVFVAHALAMHPACTRRLADGDRRFKLAFVQEIRRHYPFFPAVVARATRDFEWNGLRIERGRRALLDLYGTNHDPRTWDMPERFDPARFLDRAVGPFDLVPQGGADVRTHHRCPGEDVTTALMSLFTDHLLRSEVIPGDTELDWRRLPALPRGRILVKARAGIRQAGLADLGMGAA